MPRQKKQRLKARSDGRYKCVYKGRQFYGASPEEALAKREEYKRQEARQAYMRSDQQTVGAYAAYWLPIHKGDVSPNTLNGYHSILSHVLPPIEDKRLADVTTDDIAETFAHLRDKSASYIHKARILLTAIFQSAVDAGYILKNPCTASSIKPPKGSRGTHRTITDEERRLILTTPHRMQLPALIMLYCGLRRGEVLALTAADFHGEELIINKAVSFSGNRPVIGTTKTDAGNRRVPVPSILSPFLRDLSGFVASGANGQQMTEKAFQRGWESYQKALSAAAGHPLSIRAHDLRHSYCTMLRDAGIDMHQAIIWMGHADEKMILRIYDHPGQTREEEAKKRLNSAIQVQNEVQTKTRTAKNVV